MAFRRSGARRPLLPAPVDADGEDHVLLAQVAGFYAETLKGAPEALAWLTENAVTDPGVLDGFGLGFANRTLGYRLPQRNRRAGKVLRDRLQELGVLRSSGHEHFRGCITVPITNPAGRVVQMFGQRMGRARQERGVAGELWLPGGHGVWNLGMLDAVSEVIVCLSIRSRHLADDGRLGSRLPHPCTVQLLAATPAGLGPLAGDQLRPSGPSRWGEEERVLELRRVSCAVSMSRFFGRLWVLTGQVVFEPEGRANSLNIESAVRLVHRDRRLTVVVGRLLPPWMNSGLVLVDSGSCPTVGVVLLTAGQRRAVVAAGRTAGFDVSVHRTWLSGGGGIGSVSELERFRRGRDYPGLRGP